MTQEAKEANYSGQNIWPVDNSPYRRVFNATDRLTTFSGRQLKAVSLRDTGLFIPFGRIIKKAFGLSPMAVLIEKLISRL